MTFRGLYNRKGKTWAYDYEADSWEQAETIANEFDLYDVCKMIGNYEDMKEERLKRKVGLIGMLIIAIVVMLTVSCDDKPDCRGIAQRVEEIKALGGDNEAWIRNKLIELQLDNPECL